MTFLIGKVPETSEEFQEEMKNELSYQLVSHLINSVPIFRN